MNASTESCFDLDSLVEFVIHNAVIHCHCFRHQVKYDPILGSALNTMHTEGFSEVSLLGFFFSPMLTVNILNYKFDCKYLSEKHISTQGHLTPKI